MMIGKENDRPRLYKFIQSNTFWRSVNNVCDPGWSDFITSEKHKEHESEKQVWKQKEDAWGDIPSCSSSQSSHDTIKKKSCKAYYLNAPWNFYIFYLFRSLKTVTEQV